MFNLLLPFFQGGALYYIEHVRAEDGSWLLFVQKFLSLFWPILFDGCILTKKTWEIIEESGFGAVKYDHVYMNFPSSFFMVRTCIFGTATK